MLLGFDAYSGGADNAKKDDKKKKTEQVGKPTIKPKTQYEKLFGAKHEVVEGLFKVHKVGSKIYLELPDSLLERDFAIASTVMKTSNNGQSIVGEKPHAPMHINFSKRDSSILLTTVNHSLVMPENDNVLKSFQAGHNKSILKIYKIVAVSQDKNCSVFEATDIFLNAYEQLNPFSPYASINKTGLLQIRNNYKDDRSYIDGIKGFKNSIAVESLLSYEYSATFSGMGIAGLVNVPFSALMSRSIFLLPKEKMDIRYADQRIGYFRSIHNTWSDREPSNIRHVVNKWRLEPKDKVAYLRGELVEPVKPIVFYMDNKFPEFWKPYIKEGIERWNIAFEAAGYKNAVVVKEFPVNDPEFSISNMEYSCVHYAVNDNQNAMGPSWKDPRTGEIINASVYIYHDLIQILHDWRFIQTAQCDESVRTKQFSDEMMGDCIRYVSSHEVGHCLGLMHNMSASSLYPVDSLRSVSFTTKYGTTPSIMDYARYNYVAQPEDKGVILTPPVMGEYDKYAINWGYRYFGDNQPEKDRDILTDFVSEKIKNPIFRYGKQQTESSYDPTAQMEDLGDDPVKAAKYGIKNLKFIVSEMDNWFSPFDYDYSYTEFQLKSVRQQFNRYVAHIMTVIGGVNLNEGYRTDDIVKVNGVSGKKQKEALVAVIDILNDMDWLEPNSLKGKIDMETPFISNFRANVIGALIIKTTDVAFSVKNSLEKNSYTADQYLGDLRKMVFAGTASGRSLSANEIDTQLEFVKFISSPVIKEIKLSNSSVALHLNELSHLKSLKEVVSYVNDVEYENPVAGFKFVRKVKPGALAKLEPLYYKTLKEVREVVKINRNSGNVATRMHYDFLLNKLDKTIAD